MTTAANVASEGLVGASNCKKGLSAREGWLSTLQQEGVYWGGEEEEEACRSGKEREGASRNVDSIIGLEFPFRLSRTASRGR
jgi:hypothetical protein